MNDEKRRFMARTYPKSLKTVIDKARYGTLDECLSIGEIAELLDKDGLLKGSEEWKEAVNWLVGLVKSDLLDCENKDIALGKIDRSKEEYNKILSAFSHHGSKGYANVNFDPTKAPIKRDSLKEFLDKHDGWDLVNDFLISKWWPVEINKEKETEINPAHVGSKAKLAKDSSALELLKKKPELNEVRKKAQIKDALEKFDQKIFSSGFEDWWKTQSIFKFKDKGGAPPKK